MSASAAITSTSAFQTANEAKPGAVITQPGWTAVPTAEMMLAGPFATNVQAFVLASVVSCNLLIIARHLLAAAT